MPCNGRDVALILINWTLWSTELKILSAIAALIPIHVVEEWVFPGGFHYQMNTCCGSNHVEFWPMSRLTDMMTNLAATFIYIGLTAYCWIVGRVSDGIVLGTIIFCALEVIVHTMLGMSMYLKFRHCGKSTIYGPGSLTAYCCFGVFGGILCIGLDWMALSTCDWLVGCLISIGGIVGVCIAAPTLIFKRFSHLYPYRGTFYFEQFLSNQK